MGSFSTLGTNTFQIVRRSGSVRVQGRRSREKRNPPIDYDQALEFKEVFEEIAPVSVSARGTGIATVRAGLEQTNPNISLFGVDENYLITARYTVVEGRAISVDDVESARKVVVLGHAVTEKIFPFSSPIGEKVSIDREFFTVIGAFKEMGTASSSGGDKVVVIPVSTLRNAYPDPNRNFIISAFVSDISTLDPVMEEATGRFRLVRGLGPRNENNFDLEKSDAFVEEFVSNIRVITWGAMAIAIITLIGASVALLNVMLVSVTERTNEIGIRKALGATKKGIMTQFLTEAIVICQLGGITGVILGLIFGNIVSVSLLESSFVAPWLWIVIGLIACVVVGVSSGLYPAWKAAKVDPIDSLRHE